MKKKLLTFVALVALVVGFSACGKKDSAEKTGTSDSTAEKTLIVGASASPHAEILDHIKPLLKEKGIDLQVKVFDDYVMPNVALENGDIDANYFQHIPYFNLQLAENGYDFVNAGGIHVEPMGIYSKDIKDVKDIKDGATVIASSSTSDWGRILTIFQDAGLVKLKDGIDITAATFDDIVENPKNLTFQHELSPELLASAYNNDEADLIAINANFAVTAGLDPTTDSLLLEKDTTPYVNIIATRTELKDDERIKALVDTLHDEDVQAWIIEEFKGVVQPVNE